MRKPNGSRRDEDHAQAALPSTLGENPPCSSDAVVEQTTAPAASVRHDSRLKRGRPHSREGTRGEAPDPRRARGAPVAIPTNRAPTSSADRVDVASRKTPTSAEAELLQAPVRAPARAARPGKRLSRDTPPRLAPGRWAHVATAASPRPARRASSPAGLPPRSATVSGVSRRGMSLGVPAAPHFLAQGEDPGCKADRNRELASRTQTIGTPEAFRG